MNHAAATEGVIKFELAYVPAAPLAPRLLRPLIAWREVLARLELIGQDPARYGGAGFGNVSRRMHGDSFAVTGTQTGGLEVLEPRHFALVTACDPQRNRVEASGPVPPSSESLTHGMLYALDSRLRFVFHVHSPEIWRARERLRLPTTAPEVDYGTPAMAREIERLMRGGALARRPIIAMAGHEDGVIGVGRTADQAGTVLVRALAAALLPASSSS